MDRRRMMMVSGTPEPEIERDWLRFDILTKGAILWKCASGKKRTIEYRKNGGIWTSITSSTTGVSISVAVGDVIEFQGNHVDYGGNYTLNVLGSYFAGNATYNVSGNVSTMLGNSETLMASNAFAHIFQEARVVSAKDLILPFTTLTSGCYAYMFSNCTSLVEAPELPATTLAAYCYTNMFYGCTSLVEAPELPATTLVNYCYTGMFYGCTKLQYIKALFTTTPSSTYNSSWVYGVAAKGIFKKNPYATWDVTGNNGVPTGWGDYPGLALLIQTSGNIIWKCGANLYGTNLLLSRDFGVTWDNFRATTSGVSISVSAGEVICLGTYETYLANAYSIDNCHTLTSTATFSAVGKIKSMVDDDNSSFRGQIYNFDLPLSNFPYSLFCLFMQNTGIVSARHLEMPSNVTDYCYGNMFYGCTNLKYPPKLPVTTLADSCYRGMFNLCASLLEAPELPALTMADYCYRQMFNGCTSLTKTPELPATALALECYRYMFSDCHSLTEAPELPATTMAEGCYESMFAYCNSLTEASELPSTTLAARCYKFMFEGCLLTEAPELPATTLANECYRGMFEGCTSLTEPPELPATTLADLCYLFMFGNCTSLMEAPELPATTLVGNCYGSMFYGCSSLNKITCLAFNINAVNGTSNWVNGVAATGTFTKATAVTSWTTGVSGIPSGWTVENRDVEIDYSKLYLTIVSSADNNVIGLKQTGADISKTVEVSTDLSTWTSYTSNTSGVTLATLNTGDRLYVKGIADAYASSSSKYNTFTSTSDFDVEGNIMSLLYGDDFASKTTYPSTYTFVRLLEGCTKLINSKNLILPATTARGRCYYAMFSGCTSMITAPKLPAKTLGTYCYYGMFYNTAITEAPELPATTLATYCYYRMFRGCTGLTKSPVLPAKTLTGSCYYQMFWQCSNLNHVTMLATDISASSCLYNWLSSVAATGTLVKDASMTTLPSGASGIPSGWTVVDVFHDYSQDYFTMVVTVGGNITWTGSTTSNTLSYSKNNGNTWTTANSGTTISVSAGDMVLWKGTPTPQEESGIGTFSGDTNTRYSVEGNVMSLLFGDNFKGQTSLSGKNYALYRLLRNNTNVTSAENLSLPATTLADYCYSSMFNGCKSLTTAPQLSATTLADYCYHYMFYNCTNLTTAPELPATKLVTRCYSYMFRGCTNLSSIKCLATDISASNCTNNWVTNVASSGTFIKAASMSSWITGDNGIPSGWTAVDYSE